MLYFGENILTRRQISDWLKIGSQLLRPLLRCHQCI